jgi:hypothetical protein
MLLKRKNKKFGIYQYLENNEYINKITNMSDEKWKSYFKFCFFRNPYERLYSGFNYCMNKLNLDIEFDKYLYLNPDQISDFEYFHI